jgi:outer membrane protein OmpA-like peptidoglycan-associated protein
LPFGAAGGTAGEKAGGEAGSTSVAGGADRDGGARSIPEGDTSPLVSPALLEPAGLESRALDDPSSPRRSPTGDASADSSDARATASAEPPTTRRGGPTSTRGGWVAADHRRASAHAELISIEHANRVPDAFFASGGQRRVYVPTDAIFEPGAADLRATGALQLGRIAALLDLHPERRTVLVVHTDAGGGLDTQQRLSERRAASVRTWLLDRGHVDGDRFEVVGVGAARPLVPPDGSYGAQQPNRRIEISLAD